MLIKLSILHAPTNCHETLEKHPDISAVPCPEKPVLPSIVRFTPSKPQLPEMCPELSRFYQTFVAREPAETRLWKFEDMAMETVPVVDGSAFSTC
jgi:hypothetical protein